jgi:hypothetical protein
MLRITATRIEEEDRVEVDIVKDDANLYEIGAVAMAMDEILDKALRKKLDLGETTKAAADESRSN